MTTTYRWPTSRTRARATGLWRDPDLRPALVVWALLVLPAVVWFIHLLWVGWIPQGDEALIAIRSHDALSAHPPLLGMRSTSGNNTPGVYAHHPGPMEFYLLAIPYLLSGWHPWGLLVGCLLITVAFITFSLHAARRAAGTAGVLVAALAVVGIEALVGVALVLPLNTWTPMVGMLAVLMLAWRLVLGQLSAMPWYAVCAAYVSQAHLSFAPPVGLLTVVLAALGVVRWRRRREAIWPMPGFHPRHRAAWWRRRGWVTAYVTVLCWIPVAIEAFTGSPNNLTELSRIATAPSKATAGLGASLQQFLAMMAPQGHSTPVATGIGGAALLLAAVAAVQTTRAIRRRGFHPRDTDARIASLLGVAVTATVPLVWMGSRVQGGITLLYLELLLSVPLVLVGCAVWWVSSAVVRRLPSQAPMSTAGRLAIGVVGIVVSVLLASRAGAILGLTDYSRAVAQAHESVPRMADALDTPALRHRPVVVRWSGAMAWASVAPALEAELVARGRDVYFDGVWPNPEYDRFRRIRNAPGDAVVVLLRERTSPGARWSQAKVPAASRTMTFDLQTGNGRGQLQLLIERAPFSSSES